MEYNTRALRDLRATIGRNIHRQRRKLRLPLRRLSRLTGLSETTLDQYELGRYDIQLRELLKIACALGIEPSVLLDAGVRYGA